MRRSTVESPLGWRARRVLHFVEDTGAAARLAFPLPGLVQAQEAICPLLNASRTATACGVTAAGDVAITKRQVIALPCPHQKAKRNLSATIACPDHPVLLVVVEAGVRIYIASMLAALMGKATPLKTLRAHDATLLPKFIRVNRPGLGCVLEEPPSCTLTRCPALAPARS